jgi:hypothetical protein
MAALDSGSSDYDSDVKDTAGTAESASTKTDWQRANGMTDAIIQMQNKLGVALDGNKADLATRLLVAMDADGLLKLSDVIQIQYATDATVSAALSTNIPFDDTKPQQSTEGDLVLSKAITPKSATSILEIVAEVHLSAAAAEHLIAALFVDSTEDALAAGVKYVGAGDSVVTVSFRYLVVSASTAARTYKVHVGTATQNVVLNGIVTGPARRLGGALISSLRVTEWQV